MNNLDNILLLLRAPDAPSTAELADMIAEVVTEAGLCYRDDFADPLLTDLNHKLSDRYWQSREGALINNAVRATAEAMWQGDVRLTDDERSRLNSLLRESSQPRKDDL